MYGKIDFRCLNIMDEYNYNMNNVDIADQLRGSYRFGHWMRKKMVAMVFLSFKCF